MIKKEILRKQNRIARRIGGQRGYLARHVQIAASPLLVGPQLQTGHGAWSQ